MTTSMVPSTLVDMVGSVEIDEGNIILLTLDDLSEEDKGGDADRLSTTSDQGSSGELDAEGSGEKDLDGRLIAMV
ncbi:hypothetical protein GUJ93_ZPchr0013g34102 [Zizania palustris]|uniref:Uncharacterized protein n=1 Tax=Zizania palustris TaxID=103762 RepID=A0A8J5WS96_ZIZPA|nr:hypothetical protein GUJ93_ZPchr0013g34102 [Zizania palustris]